MHVILATRESEDDGQGRKEITTAAKIESGSEDSVRDQPQHDSCGCDGGRAPCARPTVPSEAQGAAAAAPGPAP